MAIDLVLTIVSGVVVGYFSLTALLFGSRALAEFSIKPFDANLIIGKIIATILGACLLTMVLYEIGFVWTLMLSANNPGRQHELIRVWIGASFLGFLTFSFTVFAEKNIRKGNS